MEKQAPQYDIPLHPPPISTVQASQYMDHDATLKVTRIRSAAVFFTAVLTAVVLVSGLIGAAIILKSDGQAAAVCPTPSATSSNKIADTNMAKEEELQKEDGQLLPERITYDREANTVLIDTPSNFSDNSAATFAIDFDRNVVFVNVHDEDMCLAFPLRDDVADIVKRYLEDSDNNVIDLATVPFTIENYEILGEIPAGYVQTSNGAIIRGLCSGRTTQWMAPGTGDEPEREKRGYYCYWRRICFCRWFYCRCFYYRRCIFLG